MGTIADFAVKAIQPQTPLQIENTYGNWLKLF